ncbi:hypothetical protein [Streptomyces sp. CBMA29]|uniref:hypothetical protein n=1 Tax=Streptomyces sp. CBMA29 TaxID=1896314 RepID=UPI001661B570|nr:hypothetical protein [Streptomyces sp. CBMA29]MBD0734081.1 hypothetical protein [Streptomyces sp. CBMA29]
MEKGDLAASEPEPQAFVVYEGLVAVAGPKFTQNRFARRIRMHRYRAALDLLAYNEAALMALWNLWMASRPVCLITYLPPEMMPAIQQHLDEHGVPHLRTLHVTETGMARTIAMRRDAAMVFDADPDRALMYGPKGRIIPPEHAAAMEKFL